MIKLDETTGPSFDGRCVSIDSREADYRCPNDCLPDNRLCESCYAGIVGTLDWMASIP